jgi:CHAT domain-containing protein
MFRGNRARIPLLICVCTPLIFAQDTPRSPERIAAAIAEWRAAPSPTTLLTITEKFGPIDRAFLITLMDVGDEDHQKKGDYPGALDYYDLVHAFGVAQEKNDFASVGLQLRGGIERLQGKYPEAEADYRKSLEYARRPGGEKRIPLVLNNLAGIYVAQALYSQALEILQGVLEYDAAKNIQDDAPPWQNIAIVYGLEGDLARSLDHFLVALKMYEAKGDERKIALTHYNIGVLQIKQANYEAAVRELEIALGLSRKTGDNTQLAQTLSDLGRVRDLLGQPAQALAAMKESKALCHEIGYKACYNDGLMNLGNTYLEHGQLDLAAAEFDDARRMSAEELHDSYSLGITLRGLALIAVKRGESSGARQLAMEAEEIAQRIGDIQGEWRAHSVHGMAARSLGEKAEARDAFRGAVVLIERERGLIGGGEVEKQRFFEQAVFPYQELSRLELDSGDASAALRTAERARARVLLDAMAAGPERAGQAMTEEERHEEAGLRAKLTSINQGITDARGAATQAKLRERDEAFHDYETFLAALYVRHPGLQTMRGESRPLEISDLRQVAANGRAVLVEYLCGQDETLLFVVRRGAIATHRIAIGREALGKRALAYRRMLEGRDPGFRTEAQRLYDLLLKPAGTELAGQAEIVLLPDGPLWGLPFQTLVKPNGHYLIEDAGISYAPSITFLRDRAAASAAPRTYQRDLIALGDPARRGIAPIPVLRDQVARIAALYNPGRSIVRTGAEANEAAFKDGASSARIIHLAAHGVVDGQNGLHSRVLLAPSKAGGEDGWLEAWEVMRMNLNAELVVLSACETAGGADQGEGLAGLTWALFVSGVRTAVVSQWRVEAESTTELMVGLHQRLRQNQPAATALRGSALALMKDERYRHPFYWGGFVAAGQ